MTSSSTPTFVVLGLAVLSGCGTQIGTEDQLTCLPVSTESLTDLDAIPDGFDLSPRETIDAMLGTFTGSQLADEEVVLETTATLVVSDPGGEVVLERYEPDIDEEPVNDPCPPILVTDLDYTLEADDFPAFSAAVSTTLWDRALAGSQDESAFDGEVPAPTAFDPEDFDEVVLEVRFHGYDAGWWPKVSWEAWNPDEAEPDGDVAKEIELLLWAELERI